MPYMPTVKGEPLPDDLCPARFEAQFDEYYYDEYDGLYHLTFRGHPFSIKARLPLTICLSEGVNGEDLEERHRLLPFLRIAQAIHSELGKWPEINVLWAEMCPGGVFLLDVTSLATETGNTPLPALLDEISSKLDKLSKRKIQDFSDAEQNYRKRLSGIAAFGDAITTIRREFEESPHRVVNINTKVRRLRYVAVIGSLAKTGASAARLNSQLLAWADVHSGALSAHVDSKGAILSGTGMGSAKPYLEAAKALGILAPVGRGLTLTNSGRVLTLLASNPDQFQLTEAERLFFLFELLHWDRDFVWPLLLLLRDNPSVSKSALRAIFPDAYRAHLVRLRSFCGKSRPRRLLDEALSRVDKWERADSYMEHIVDPRVSWFVDLGLCSLDRTDIVLLPRGKALADEIVALADEGLLVITQEYLRRWFFRTIARHLEGQGRNIQTKLSRMSAIKILKRCCEELRLRTTSLVPNRIVASTLFRLASIIFFTEHAVAVDFADLHKLCSLPENVDQLGWRLRWSAAQNDGYLMPLSPAGAAI
jgi:hypothetical protein